MRRKYRPVAAVLVGLLLASCSQLGLVPIQMVRAPQFESYEQTFYFGGVSWPPREAAYLNPETQRRINAEIDSNFRYMIGEKNWQTLKDKYGLGPLRDELLRQKLKLTGSVYMVFTISARDHDRFFVEGSGRFFLVRERTEEILLNGDFQIIPVSQNLEMLDSGFIDLDVLLVISRVPGEMTYRHSTRVRYRIKIDKLRPADEVYAIDYDHAHEVLLPPADGAVTGPLSPVGHLRFHRAASDPKYLDLRGRQLLRKDY